MLKKLKRNLTIMVVVCLITVVAVIAPFYSNASSVEPTATIDIEKVNKEFLEVDPATAAVDSDEDISVELLEETLATDVVELEDTNEVLSYLANPSKIKELKLFRPSSVDNSDSKYFPKIMNQGSLNSCTTWSTVYYQMSYAVNKALDRDASSTENVFSPSWIYTMVNEGENLGNYYADILKILSEIGAVPLSKVPAMSEVEGDNIRNVKADKELWLEASKYKVDEYYSIDLKRESKTPVIESPKDKDLDAIKKALALGEVLTGTTYSYKWNKAKIQADTRVKENAKYAGEYIVTDCTGKMKGAHRITIVGYNDKIWVDINGDYVVDKGEKGAFKIANSYGETKDNKGFAWMSYDAVNAVSCLTKEGEQVDADRDAGIFDVIGFNIKVDEEQNDCFAVLGVETSDLKSLTVKVTATKEDGTVSEYEPAPFTNAMIRGMGAYPFNSSESGTKGVFFINLANVVKDVNTDNVEDIEWKFEIASTSKENESKINSLSIYTQENNTYTDSYVEDSIPLKNNMANIKIAKKQPTGYMALARYF